MNRLFILLLAVSLSFSAFSAGAQAVYNSSTGTAQRSTHYKPKKKKTGFDRDKLVFGGAPVLAFGSGSLALGIAPIAGYRFTDRFLAGIGLNYIYYRQKDAYVVGTDLYDYKANVYSASVWARYLVFENIFVHAEYEHNFMRYTDVRYDPGGSGNIETYWIKYNSPSLLLGGGYRSPISSNASLVGMLLYDVLQDKNSPYRGGPSIRIGVNVGF